MTVADCQRQKINCCWTSLPVVRGRWQFNAQWITFRLTTSANSYKIPSLYMTYVIYHEFPCLENGLLLNSMTRGHPGFYSQFCGLLLRRNTQYPKHSRSMQKNTDTRHMPALTFITATSMMTASQARCVKVIKWARDNVKVTILHTVWNSMTFPWHSCPC